MDPVKLWAFEGQQWITINRTIKLLGARGKYDKAYISWSVWKHLPSEGMLRTLRFESLCSIVQLDGWNALLDDTSHQPGQEEKERSDICSRRLYRALTVGDSRGLRTLLKRNYIDLDVFYNVNREELQWQANTATTFGPSGKQPSGRRKIEIELR